MLAKVKAILANEDGQGMVEYGLILGLIAIVAVGALILLGPKIAEMFQGATDKLESVTTAAAGD